ncbi:Pimeloyl-ACP methyl ester carboxylesterase [Streptoalloteichus hindustanus]|uniref:Pimeloyl-ACP methyl ester carboxylesterase n=1 Tax=Streptoalloteichus hindustanus TaxID=2017 RepID=A0A1M5EJY5_STRHI|nr:Pimeloyl-ACP methyl ester carboxylesterase [Streptoalloteichus hindustanus]
MLLCPGAATSRWLGFGTDVVDELGVRLVSVDRPGLGASDPAPGRTLSDWAADVRHLAAERGLVDLAVVGMSAGVPFALVCAAAGVAVAAAVVSGDELASPAFTGLLTPEVRDLVALATTDPARAEEVFADFGSVETLWEIAVERSSGTDGAVYRQPAFASAFRRALTEAFARGPAGYARDTVLVMAPWPFDPAEITVPVDLWYGGRDTSPVHSPDLGATLAGRLPDARRHVVPEAGGSLLWTHAREILDSLVRPRARG